MIVGYYSFLFDYRRHWSVAEQCE